MHKSLKSCLRQTAAWAGGRRGQSARCGGSSRDSAGGARVRPRACGDGCVGGSAPRRGPRVSGDRRCRTSRRTPETRPGACVCSAASARPVAACATIAGRFVPVGPCVSRGAQAGGVRPLRPPGACQCRGGACALTRCRVVRGGGVMRGAGRRGRLGGAAAGLAPPAPAAPDRRPVGLRRRAVPAHE